MEFVEPSSVVDQVVVVHNSESLNATQVGATTHIHLHQLPRTSGNFDLYLLMLFNYSTFDNLLSQKL